MSAVRVYTTTFGKNLLKAYTSWLDRPADDRADLPGRDVVDLSLSDKEIFQGLQGEDEWIESGMHEVFEYLYCGRRLVYLDLYIRSASCNGGSNYESKFQHVRTPKDSRYLATRDGRLPHPASWESPLQALMIISRHIDPARSYIRSCRIPCCVAAGLKLQM